MSTFFLFVVMATGGEPFVLTEDPSLTLQARQEAISPIELLEREVVTGTLIFSQGDCLAVKAYTQSPYTHVGVVVRRNDSAIIYDSTAGKGVRCQTLTNYLDDQNPAEIYVFHPRKPLTEEKSQ
ncbi:MAG: YiiX/YebB-like N1pC/P60 family cysteine hydrolase [Planctomycetota bacterium]|nr:YiiX/YebB-like N1pC/P60 family cysteine hydrolase [Planctomycetota bacterium]MDA1214162.1 YiiX/YebB-like N1pC/P60 family cysteine hydrolase [Planctomycetota bacterium]